VKDAGTVMRIAMAAAAVALACHETLGAQSAHWCRAGIRTVAHLIRGRAHRGRRPWPWLGRYT
jgi:hypothetical protein